MFNIGDSVIIKPHRQAEFLPFGVGHVKAHYSQHGILVDFYDGCALRFFYNRTLKIAQNIQLEFPFMKGK